MLTNPQNHFSLDKTDVDERLNKDMSDFITMRIGRSPTIQNNITPTVVKMDSKLRETVLRPTGDEPL